MKRVADRHWLAKRATFGFIKWMDEYDSCHIILFLFSTLSKKAKEIFIYLTDHNQKYH